MLDNLVLLDGDGEEVDVLEGLDLALLHEAAELGAGGPAVAVLVVATAAAAPAAAIAAPAVTAATIAAPESTAEAATLTTTVSHCD